jgi:hypothetical protein
MKGPRGIASPANAEHIVGVALSAFAHVDRRRPLATWRRVLSQPADCRPIVPAWGGGENGGQSFNSSNSRAAREEGPEQYLKSPICASAAGHTSA